MFVIVDNVKERIYKNIRPVHLTRNEFRLYQYLSGLSGQTVPSHLLIAHIWPGRHETITQNNLSQLVFRLREKLKRHHLPVSIKASLKYGCVFQHKKAVILISVNNCLLSSFFNFISGHYFKA